MKRLLMIALALGALIVLLAGCTEADEAAAPSVTAVPPPVATSRPTVTTVPTPVPIVRLMTHDSFNVSEEVLQAFEEEYNIVVELLPAGDTGAALNQAILSKDDPLADLFFGVDNTFLSRALEAGIFEPYDAPALEGIPAQFRLDPQNRLLPVDYGDVCLNYDKAWFAAANLAPPSSLEDLAQPEYADLLVVENPATSSPGLAFLLATIGHFGPENYLDYWTDLRGNGVLVTDGWEDAYWGQFTAASDGDRPIVVSYASSPPAEVYYAEQELSEAPTASVLAEGSCFRQIEFVGILVGTEQRTAAEKLVDFMLSVRFQEDIPLQMFVFPVNPDARLPELFVRFADIPERPATVDPAEIEANRERWIQAWTEAVLR
jgi:thiamine transport system substrate-binding protein